LRKELINQFKRVDCKIIKRLINNDNKLIEDEKNEKKKERKRKSKT